jgi:hypothetical protein
MDVRLQNIPRIQFRARDWISLYKETGVVVVLQYRDEGIITRKYGLGIRALGIGAIGHWGNKALGH